MNRNDAPKKQPVPFAVNGQREGLLNNTPAGDNTASYNDGFPPVTMILKAAGGLPPKGQDMNQILFELASGIRWSQAGGSYNYDATFSESIGGYPAGATLEATDGSGQWITVTDANKNDPEAGSPSSSGWRPLNQIGITTVSGISSSDVTLTALQAAKPVIFLTGALAANVSVIFPTWDKVWKVVNLCTGPFTLTLKTAGGNAVTVPQGGNLEIFGDGANIYSYFGSAAYRGVGTSSGTVAAGDDSRITGALQKTGNLSELTDKAGARSNLGLGGSAVLNIGTTANTVASGDDSRITGALQKTGNLFELTDKAGARSNLGLGNSAVLNVGKASSTVAAGDDSRIIGALQKTANLADLSDPAGARNNLGLGLAALRNVGTGANQIPDMSSWETDANSNGHLKLPNGIYIQWYTANLAQGNNTITFPTPFPNFFLADAGMQGLSSTVGGVSATKATRTYYSNAANTACFIAIGL